MGAGDGVFVCKYNSLSLIPGDYIITIKIDSEIFARFLVKTLENSSDYHMLNLADPKKCFIVGPMMEETMIYIRSYDGKPTQGNCKVELKGPNGLVKIEGNKIDKSTFQAAYSALNKEPGEYIMDVSINLQLIAKFKILTMAKSSQLDIGK